MTNIVTRKVYGQRNCELIWLVLLLSPLPPSFPPPSPSGAVKFQDHQSSTPSIFWHFANKQRRVFDMASKNMAISENKEYLKSFTCTYSCIPESRTETESIIGVKSKPWKKDMFCLQSAIKTKVALVNINCKSSVCVKNVTFWQLLQVDLLMHFTFERFEKKLEFFDVRLSCDNNHTSITMHTGAIKF